MSNILSLTGGFGDTLILALLVLVLAVFLACLIWLRNEGIRRLSIWTPKQARKLLDHIKSRL